MSHEARVVPQTWPYFRGFGVQRASVECASGRGVAIVTARTARLHRARLTRLQLAHCTNTGTRLGKDSHNPSLHMREPMNEMEP